MVSQVPWSAPKTSIIPGLNDYMVKRGYVVHAHIRTVVLSGFLCLSGDALRMVFVSPPAYQARHALPDAMRIVTNKGKIHGARCYEHFLA